MAQLRWQNPQMAQARWQWLSFVGTGQLAPFSLPTRAQPPAATRMVNPDFARSLAAYIWTSQPSAGRDRHVRIARSSARLIYLSRLVVDLAVSTILSFVAILDLDLQPEQTIALPMIMAGQDQN